MRVRLRDGREATLTRAAGCADDREGAAMSLQGLANQSRRARAAADKAAAVIVEAERLLQFLASMPSGICSAERAVVRHIMLTTDGRLHSQGGLYDIVAHPLGGGVSRLTLRPVGTERVTPR